MLWLLILTGPATYLMRVCGLLLSRTRLVPRQMASTLALVSIAVLAALVAPSLLLPQGHLAANPLTNPRLLVALVLVLLILRLRHRVQVLLVVTPLVGMGLLWVLLWFPDISMTLSLPLALLLLASAGLVVLLGRPLVRLISRQRASGASGQVLAPPAVTMTPVVNRQLPAEAVSLPAQPAAGAHLHCAWCWCPLPMWALYCGRRGLPQQTPALAPTQPLAAVTIKPDESRPSSTAVVRHAPSTYH